MPFNPILDNYGDDAWTDLEADTESDREGSQHDQEASKIRFPRLQAQIIELVSDESACEADGADAPSRILVEESGEARAVHAQTTEEYERVLVEENDENEDEQADQRAGHGPEDEPNHKTTSGSNLPANRLDDVHAAFVESQARKEDECASVRCIYCNHTRAKNVFRMRQHLFFECLSCHKVMKESRAAHNSLQQSAESNIAQPLSLPAPKVELDFEDGQADLGHESMVDSEALLASDRASTEASDHQDILKDFLQAPRRDGRRSKVSEASQRTLIPANDNMSEVYDWEDPSPRKPIRCGRCMRSHKHCDGVRPVCGRCVSIGRKSCWWPPRRITLNEYINLRRRGKATTPPPPRTASSIPLDVTLATFANSPAGNAMVPDNHERAILRGDLVYSDINPDGGPVHSKDLVFSDVLPTSEEANGAAEQQIGGSDRKAQYLDLCEPDSTTTSPLQSGAAEKPVISNTKSALPWDQALIKLKTEGLSCGQIKIQLNLQEAEHAIRKRWNALKKAGLVMKPMGFACRPCKTANRRCDGMVPCGGCADLGLRDKCFYVGGRGGGGATAKHLYKPVESASQTALTATPDKRPQSTTPSHSPAKLALKRTSTTVGSITESAAMRPRRVTATMSHSLNSASESLSVTAHALASAPLRTGNTQKVYCRQCTKCHSTCDAKLPCGRCRDRGIANQCSYSECYIAADSHNEAVDATSMLSESPIRTHDPMSVPPEQHRGVTPRVRMVLLNPEDRRAPICDQCCRCHSSCDAMLPCQRCIAKASTTGEPCSYSKRYVPDASDGNGTAATDSGYSTLSPLTSALLGGNGSNGTPSRREAQPVTRHIISDSDTDNEEACADIVHEEDSIDNDTVEIAGPAKPTPSVRDSLLSLLKSRDNTASSSTRKRRASDSLNEPHLPDSQQPALKRARLDSVETAWRPSGGAKRKANSEDRAVTRLSTSTGKRPLYARPSLLQSDGEDDKRDTEVRPEDVPSVIREVFANMSQDVLLDIFPEKSGRGRMSFDRIRVPQKQPGDYSKGPEAVKLRERLARMSDAEHLLQLREKADSKALFTAMRQVREDPFSGWDEMTAAAQEALKVEKEREVQRQRDEWGRSANFYVGQLAKLATSCVGEEAMMRFLISDAAVRKRIVGLFHGLIDLEEDGKLRLRAGNSEQD